MDWKPIDEEIVPTPFFDDDCCGKTFKWLLENRPVFCTDVLENFSECTGFWKVLRTYLKNKR